MGYCDLNFIVELKLKNGTPYLAEVQVNHDAMLEAKSEAHTYYTRWCASGCPSCARAAPRRPCARRDVGKGARADSAMSTRTAAA